MAASPSYVLMMNPGQVSNTPGSALTNTVTLTDISGGANVAGEAYTIPANFMQTGQVWRFTASGIFTTTSTPTLLLGLYAGGVAGTALAATIAVTTPSGVTNQSWLLEATMRVTAPGTSGTVVTQGCVTGIESVSLTGASASTTMMPETTSTGGQSTQNTSVANILTVGAQWGTAASGNSITCEQFIIELLTA